MIYYYYPTYIPFQISPIFPIIKYLLWHLFLWSRSQSRITHFFGCHVSCLLFSRMVSQLLCALYEIHTLEYRLVVCGRSSSWVSLIISPGCFSEFPRAPPHVWSGAGPSSSVCLADLTALHMAAASVPTHFKRRPSSLSVDSHHSDPLRPLRKCTAAPWPLTPNSEWLFLNSSQHTWGWAVAFQQNFIQCLRVTQT